jgi:23S rRNA (cytidine1920-2'-O)/16S rRNA (cytidine1409-2'-O)-methyltransferase
MQKLRLDKLVLDSGLASTRSQAENYIRLGQISVDGEVIQKPGYFVRPDVKLKFLASAQYVSRAGLKLASVSKTLGLNFKDAVVLDIGSSTGGFTDYALQNGAQKVYAVDVGTNQLHPSLHGNPRIELHEQTDIRDFSPTTVPNIVVIDVSFISLREILPHVAKISGKDTQIAAMLKPQFEAGANTKHKGVIKNDAVRRKILQDFEVWVKQYFVIRAKSDSEVTGTKGNRERFYLLTPIQKNKQHAKPSSASSNH